MFFEKTEWGNIMFNRQAKKNALGKVASEEKNFNAEKHLVTRAAEDLYHQRMSLKQTVLDGWELINSFRNKPETLTVELQAVKVEFDRYESVLTALEEESAKATAKQGAGAAAGVAAMGAAAMAPTALMGLATTFGTASTGTAISALAGAAQVNAALAWLGGGTLAAGGGGMALGNTFLVAAGPIGWAIGATALMGSGLMYGHKNKKIAEEANTQAEKLHASTKIMSGTYFEIHQLIEDTKEIDKQLVETQKSTAQSDRDFSNLDDEQQYRLGSYVNNLQSALKLMNRTIGEQASN